MARAKKKAPVAPGVGAGERWRTGRGDAATLYIASDSKRRVRIGDFALGGRAPGGSAAAVERALIAAQAPLMYEALLDLLSGMREDGAIVELDGRPYEGHRPGCGCGVCAGLLALALAEGGGRCVICGCTEFDACPDGCAWVDGEQLVCTAHPPSVISAARRFLAAPHRKERT